MCPVYAGLKLSALPKAAAQKTRVKLSIALSFYGDLQNHNKEAIHLSLLELSLLDNECRYPKEIIPKEKGGSPLCYDFVDRLSKK